MISLGPFFRAKSYRYIHVVVSKFLCSYHAVLRNHSKVLFTCIHPAKMLLLIMTLKVFEKIRYAMMFQYYKPLWKSDNSIPVKVLFKTAREIHTYNYINLFTSYLFVGFGMKQMYTYCVVRTFYSTCVLRWLYGKMFIRFYAVWNCLCSRKLIFYQKGKFTHLFSWNIVGGTVVFVVHCFPASSKQLSIYTFKPIMAHFPN